MPQFNHAAWPKLQQYWDVDYGMGIPFVKLDRFKIRNDGGYIVVGWVEHGMIQLADLAFVNGEWDMCNDGFDPITEEQWDLLYVDEYCDSFRFSKYKR